MKYLLAAMLLVCAQFSQAQTPAPDRLRTPADVAATVAKEATNEAKTRALITWMSSNLKWTYTDYQKRTPAEILERGAGNCADLASVLAVLLTESKVPYRWISEINIQPSDDGRQASAEQIVAKSGARASVFGRIHNDHVWLEVLDERDGAWIPADPASGIVGLKDWIASRMAFSDRRISPIPEVADVLATMYTPVFVTLTESRRGKLGAPRSSYYLEDAFNRAYGGKLAQLPSWNRWKQQVDAFTALGTGAFAGEINLHQHEQQLQELSATYFALKAEAKNAGLQATL